MKNSRFALSVKRAKKELSPLFATIHSDSSFVLPVLSSILVENNGALALSATDLENWVRIETPLQTPEKFTACVPSKSLSFVLSNAMDDSVEICIDGNEVKIKNGDFSAKVVSDSADSYPVRPELKETYIRMDIKASVFIPMIANAMKFVSKDDLRPAMCGVHLRDWEGGLYVVATDAHRLYYKKLMDTPAAFKDKGCIIPARGASLLIKLLSGSETISVSIHDEKTILFSAGGKSLSSRLIDARYPNFPVVIPQFTPISMYLKRKQLSALLRLSEPFLNRSTKQIEISVTQDKMEITGKDVDYSLEVGYTVPVYNSSGISESFRFAVNCSFLLECLSVSKDEYVKITHTGESTKAIILDGYVLMMPLMLNS